MYSTWIRFNTNKSLLIVFASWYYLCLDSRSPSGFTFLLPSKCPSSHGDTCCWLLLPLDSYHFVQLAINYFLSFFFYLGISSSFCASINIHCFRFLPPDANIASHCDIGTTPHQRHQPPTIVSTSCLQLPHHQPLSSLPCLWPLCLQSSLHYRCFNKLTSDAYQIIRASPSRVANPVLNI